MFDKNDARASLNMGDKRAAATAYSDPEVVNFYDVEPSEFADGARTWYARGQNFIISFSETTDECHLPRTDQKDEYAVIFLDGNGELEINAGRETQIVGSKSLAFVPSGQSSLHMSGGGRIMRLFTTKATDLLPLCSNAQSYKTPHPNVAPFEPWPAPIEGDRLRVYDMNVPLEGGRFGRIWRSSNFMINFLGEKNGPRDVTKMSPHSHDDFEQCSFASTGEFVHHLRWPWTTDMNIWKEDVHEHMQSPSMIVIPPLCEHTTQATGADINQLFDIFCPPRADFSSKPGWVLNELDYPIER